MTPSMHGAAFVTDLAIVLGVAAITGVLARLMRQPTILGYLLAGLVVGPYIPVPVFADPERVGALAEFGVILVM
ncbi:MAG: sodium:proton exchanger, partial [Polyangiales bacterium]